MSQGGGRGSAKVSRDIFFQQIAAFWYFCLLKTQSFRKKIICHVTYRRGGGTGQCHQMTQGGGGGLKLAKKVSRII
jgi:hypothetical protein